MPNVTAGAVCAGISFVAAAMLAVVLAGAGRSLAASAGGQRFPRYVAWATIVGAALLAACIGGGSSGAVCTAFAGALAGAWLLQRTDLAKRPRFLAASGSGVGFVAIAGAFARYARSAAQAAPERFAMYIGVFAGALLLAASAIAFFRLRGPMNMRVAACPGCAVVDLTALLLCAWLGYGFVTDITQTFGLAALLATSGLAAALGAHLMMTVDDRFGLSFAAAGDEHHFHCRVVQARAVGVRFETQRWTVAGDVRTSRCMTAASRNGNRLAARERGRERPRVTRS